MPVYIVDDDFRIVYANSELKRLAPDLQVGDRCHKVICGEPGQCVNCPLGKENQGRAVVFSQLHGECVSATSADIEWQGNENCHIVMMSSMLGQKKTFYYNAAGKSDYDELLEMNYATDTYRVLYHGDRKESNANTSGKISTMVRYVAERVIHPRDRQRFYEFWLLDQIGEKSVTNEMLKTRHGEFRRLRSDGSYGWAQQVCMPAKQNADGSFYIMSFHNRLDTAGEWDPQGEDVLRALTDNGLYDKQGFFEAVESFLRSNASSGTSWCMLAIDIENLKLFNEWYGLNEGNNLIAGVANCLQNLTNLEYSIGGYFGNDDFGLVMPYDEDKIDGLYGQINTLLETYGNKIGFMPTIGVYEITDPNEPAFTMYDRAELARGTAKGNYTVRVKKFDQKMMEGLTSNYILYSDIKRALREKEFTFFLQPKCNIKNGKIIGAEALVRWINKSGEMISPGVFIPFLEKSGFISELDPYIWEEVCRWQRGRLDRGYQPVPVSVNVSRVDIYSMDVPAYFCGLIQKYRLDPKLIEVEITESAYTEDNHRVSAVVAELRRSGFRVLMDDFGSGYSSLNMLKEVEVDVLKVDMRFLKIDENNAGRGIGILQTIHNMARVMGTGIIVEGVETEEQKTFLLEMGCGYAQGYYFYRPMPIRDFEMEIKNSDILDSEGYLDRADERFFLKDLLSEDLFSEIMINNMLGAVAFYDVYNGDVTVKRYNDLYANQFGIPTGTGRRQSFRECLYEGDRDRIMNIFKNARINRNKGAEGEVRRRRPDGSIRWLHLRAFFLREQDGHTIYYSAVSDVTDIHRKNEELKQKNLALRFLNEDMPGGYYRHENNADANFLFISQRFLDIVGFTRDEIKHRFRSKFMNMVHPDDRAMVTRSMKALFQSGGDHSLTYRLQHKTGYIVVTDQCRLVNYDGHQFFQGVILRDLHEDALYEMGGGEKYKTDQYDLNLAPCGIYQAEADGEMRFRYVSNSLLNMLGYTRQAFEEKFPNTKAFCWNEDEKRVTDDVLSQMRRSHVVSCEHRVETVDGSLKWLYSRGRITVDADGNRLYNVCVMDYDYLKLKYREQEWQYLKYKSLAEIPGMLVYDYDPDKDRMTLEITQADGTPQSLISDQFIEDIEHHLWIAPEHTAELKSKLLAATKNPMGDSVEFKACLGAEPQFHWYRSYFRSLADEYGKVYRIVGRADCIDHQKRSLDEWKELAMRDRMTGLLNSEAGREMAEMAVQKYRSGTLLLLDVDNFKEINDTVGHQQGDKVLKEIADAIHTTFRREDVLSRMGGDEFLIFLPKLSDRETVEKKAEVLLEKINGICLPENRPVKCSVGIAMTEDTLSVDMLLREADIALYEAKRGGKDKYVFFTKKVSNL